MPAKGLKKKADDAFSRWIRARDRWCQNCGRVPGLQCAHLITRLEWSTRYDPDNAVALCAGCHVMFTNHPYLWNDWCEERLGPEAWLALKRKARNIDAEGNKLPPYRTDFAAVIERFQEVAE